MRATDSGEVPVASGRAAAAAWLLLVIAMTAAFYRNFIEMWLRWFPAWHRADLSLYDRIVEGESYYTHGPLIPVISLLISVLLIRHVRIPVRPSRRWGALLLGGSILLHLVASLARVNFASGFAFVGVVAALVLILWGAAALRQLWFPIVFLVFLVPLPEVTIAQLNFRLKMFASQWGVALANAVGVIAERSGNRVFLEGGKDLVVANVCNGLRTLISLLAFGSLYAYVCRLRGLWRMGLFAMTIPVAVVCNAGRIVILIIVADVWDVQTATGWFHDTSGILIFVMAFMLMFSIERLVLWSRRAVGRPAEILPLFNGRLRDATDEGQWSRMLMLPVRRVFISGVIVLLAAGGAWWLGRTIPSGLTGDMIRQAVPENLKIQGRLFRSREQELDQNTLTILENPSYINRQYSSMGLSPINFCLIYSKDNRKGTHPPDLCLEGSGEGIKDKADIVIRDVPGCGDVPCRELVVQSPFGDVYYLYTYKCGSRYTRSFWVQQFIIFGNGLLGRNAGGALIRVSTPVGASLDDARQRSISMMRAALPHLQRNIP